MTEEDLAKTYELAYRNAVHYGTGFVRIAFVKGEFELSVVPPEDYHFVTKDLPKVDPVPLFDDWSEK